MEVPFILDRDLRLALGSTFFVNGEFLREVRLILDWAGNIGLDSKYRQGGVSL